MNLIALIKTRFTTTGEGNRRRHERHRRVTLLTIQPLDDDLCAFGTQFWGMSQDISASGIGFTTQTPIMTNYLQISIVEDDKSSIAVVRHIRMIDEVNIRYFVGAEYLDDYSCHDRSRC